MQASEQWSLKNGAINNNKPRPCGFAGKGDIMKQITVKELLERWVQAVKEGNGDKNIVISDDNDVDHIADEVYTAGYQKVLIDTEDGKMVDCVQYTPWQSIEEYTEREVEKARKDTAKAILNVLYFNLQNSVKGHIAKSNVYYNVMNRIQEIAKNYGVEIEE